MKKRVYNSAQEVCDVLRDGKVKRNSMLVMKRQAKRRNDDNTYQVMRDGIEMFDNSFKDLLFCSFYNKPISSLSLYDIVKLDIDNPELVTYYHNIRYTMVMLGETGDLLSYKGVILSPKEMRYL